MEGEAGEAARAELEAQERELEWEGRKPTREERRKRRSEKRKNISTRLRSLFRRSEEAQATQAANGDEAERERVGRELREAAIEWFYLAFRVR